MYLKSLEIAGFKSFAKKAVLEFNSSITAIVGPNGSGKSNVAEAFRFVLGEQSMKSLRGKKGEDLIFNGGKDQSRLNRASVKMVFDNRNRALSIDFDEVVIERVVHRDSANDYFINGSSVRLKDISELLASAHIGASGHHIISQGEADRILNANLRERREMIEDALGLKVYLYKKEESVRKLDKTQENLKQVESLRKEIAPHIRFLEKQVEKVQKAREMRIQLENLYKNYFKREEIYISFEKSRLADDRRQPDQKLKALEQELIQAKDVLARSTQKDQKSDELLSLEQKLQAVRTERDNLVRETGRLDGQISFEERQLAKQQHALSSNDTKTIYLKEVQGVADAMYQQLDEAERVEDVPTLKSILKGVKQLMVEFINHNKEQTDTSEIEELQREISRLKADRAQIQTSFDSVRKNEQDLLTTYNTLQSDIEKEKDSNRDAEKAVFRIMAEQNELISVLNNIRNQEERLTLIESDFKREIQEAAVLVGRAVLDYPNFKIINGENWELPSEEIVLEPRAGQEDRRKTIERIKIRLEDAGGGSGEEIMKEFSEAQERDGFLMREIEDLQKSSETLKVLIKDLDEKLTAEFKAGVEKINSQFSNYFALMFGGGSASLSVIREQKRRRKTETELLTDESDEEFIEEEGEEGIDIAVNLPQKKVKALMMLSGGERALTSIALLFAISQVNPPPFIILDETDAALDEANSRKYGDMISNLAEYSQLILITHNRETMSRAGILYGVTMGAEGASKLLSIKFDQAVQVAK